MKIIYIVVNVSNLEILISKIKTIGFTDYQIIEKISSVSSKGNPRLNTSVWPGFSSGVLVQTNDHVKTETLLDVIRQHNAERFNDEEIIKAYVWNVELAVVE